MPTLIRNVTFALLQRFGYWRTGQRGSHVYMTNADGNDITLVNHGNRPISAGTIGKIVEQAGIDPDHFLWGWGGLTATDAPRPGGLASRLSVLNWQCWSDGVGTNKYSPLRGQVVNFQLHRVAPPD